MRRAGGAVIAALAGFWLLVQSPLAFAAGPDCLRGFITELRKAVADQDEAEDMFARITIFSDDGARGATMAIQQVRGDRFAVLWENLDELQRLRRNPFAKDDEVFEVYAKLVDLDKAGGPTVFGHLASEKLNDSQGALFQFFVTKKTAGNGTNYALIDDLEKELTGIGGATRRMDLVEVNGNLHEIKAWFEPLANGTEKKLLDYALEFQSDIVLCADRGFLNYRVHFPDVINTKTQRDWIKATLMQQFNEPAVIAHFAADPGALALAKLEFSTAWDSGLIAQFHAF